MVVFGAWLTAHASKVAAVLLSGMTSVFWDPATVFPDDGEAVRQDLDIQSPNMSVAPAAKRH